ncbi:hypothetical protein BH11PLA1_BH11PLA1_22250 [soil metagenome]
MSTLENQKISSGAEVELSAKKAGEKPRRLGRGLNSLIGEPVPVRIPGVGGVPARSSNMGLNAYDSEVGVRGGVVGGAQKDEDPVLANRAPSEAGGERRARQVLPDGRELVMVGVGEVAANRWQPRRGFDEGALKELAESLRKTGIMQPIVVRRIKGSGGATEHKKAANTIEVVGAPSARGGGEAERGGLRAAILPTDGGAGVAVIYELVAGERRLRAAAMVGMEELPGVVVDITDQEAAEWGLVENMQRAELTAMDKAASFRRMQREFGMSQGEIADRLGIGRTVVTAHLLILDLEPEILEELETGRLTLGHARLLMSATVKPGDDRIQLAQRAGREGWSLRRLERRVRSGRDDETERREIEAGDGGGGVAREDGAAAEMRLRRSAHVRHIQELERAMSARLGTKVKIAGKAALVPGAMEGRIELSFYDLLTFEGLLKAMRMKLGEDGLPGVLEGGGGDGGGGRDKGVVKRRYV